MLFSSVQLSVGALSISLFCPKRIKEIGQRAAQPPVTDAGAESCWRKVIHQRRWHFDTNNALVVVFVAVMHLFLYYCVIIHELHSQKGGGGIVNLNCKYRTPSMLTGKNRYTGYSLLYILEGKTFLLYVKDIPVGLRSKPLYTFTVKLLTGLKEIHHS